MLQRFIPNEITFIDSHKYLEDNITEWRQQTKWSKKQHNILLGKL